MGNLLQNKSRREDLPPNALRQEDGYVLARGVRIG